MDFYEREVLKHLQFLEGLHGVGSDALEIEKSIWVHAVLLAGLASLLGSGHPVVRLFALVSMVLTAVDMVFVLNGFGSVMALVAA